jgi:hypothetical protein
MITTIVYLQAGRGPACRSHCVAVTLSITDPNTAYTEACRLALETVPPTDRHNWEVNLGETHLVDQTVIRITS